MSYDYKAIVPYLLHWFAYNARILPWRENPVPYYVWVSEIMLQQTRVEAVKGYFDRFTAALPDIGALAGAQEEKLLKLWEGLGYYNRVRNLQKTARLVLEEYDGEMPADYEQLKKLPGIGEYTAGAIASIAFGIPVPAVDGNVLRVMKRIAGSYDDITKDSVRKELWQDIIGIIPLDRPGDFNQSLMELGATVCLPNGKPLCDKCPVMHLCRAFQQEITQLLPVKPEKKARKKVERTILLLEYDHKIAIRKRPSKGLLAGLWELPGLEGYVTASELLSLLSGWGIPRPEIADLGRAKHIFTHVEWHMTGYHIHLDKLPQLPKGEIPLLWADREEIADRYSIPNAFKFYFVK